MTRDNKKVPLLRAHLLTGRSVIEAYAAEEKIIPLYDALRDAGALEPKRRYGCRPIDLLNITEPPDTLYFHSDDYKMMTGLGLVEMRDDAAAFTTIRITPLGREVKKMLREGGYKFRAPCMGNEQETGQKVGRPVS